MPFHVCLDLYCAFTVSVCARCAYTHCYKAGTLLYMHWALKWRGGRGADLPLSGKGGCDRSGLST